MTVYRAFCVMFYIEDKEDYCEKEELGTASEE
jgi:hypothetical protein